MILNDQDWKCRTRLLLGDQNLEKIGRAHVLVAGLGGVGGYAAELLCRAGIGKLTLIDCDTVQPSNRNRQNIALCSTEGQDKTSVVAQRLRDINPDAELKIVHEFLDENNIVSLLGDNFDYVIDAIDSLTPKVALIVQAKSKGLRIISSMGAAGKTDPAQVKIADISKSHHCKFAYMVRKYLHRLGIREGIKVVFSAEPVPKESIIETDGKGNKRSVIGTISYMPAIFGCYCASEVIRDIIA